jgi:hypothetical protein
LKQPEHNAWQHQSAVAQSPGESIALSDTRFDARNGSTPHARGDAPEGAKGLPKREAALDKFGKDPKSDSQVFVTRPDWSFGPHRR